MMHKPRQVAAGKEIYRRQAVDAKTRATERRAEVRFPFFRAASIEMDDGHQFAAFTRDISNLGIGLIHNVGLAPGEFDVTISSETSIWIKVRTRIDWCKSCGEGWYISGGAFIGTAVAVGQAAAFGP